MEKEIYIVVANIGFLKEKNFIYTFRNGTEEEVSAFCDYNYDRADCELCVYPIDVYVSEVNEGYIDWENSLIRKITK